jgi:hypothetical protein
LITSTTGDIVIDNTAVAGKSIVQLGTNTSATAFQVKSDAGTVLLSVNGAGAVTLGTPIAASVETLSGLTPAKPDVAFDFTFVDLQTATGTVTATGGSMADGTVVGQQKTVVVLTNTNDAAYKFTIGNFVSASGSVSNKTLTMLSGQGIAMVWTGATWYQTNGGATISAA